MPLVTVHYKFDIDTLIEEIFTQTPYSLINEL